MAFDEDLADRIRELISGKKGITEKKMFGGPSRHPHQGGFVKVDRPWDQLRKNFDATVAMKTRYRIPRVEAVEVPRRYVLRLTFNDGLVREVEFIPSGNPASTLNAEFMVGGSQPGAKRCQT